ncbi:MAG: hypothetical protein EOP84_10910, partial [Verrucomicrobiaceae bacterium]
MTQAGILTGPAIRAALASGAIECNPLDPEQVAQASIDVHLHPTLLIYEVQPIPGQVVPAVANGPIGRPLDLAKECGVQRLTIPPEGV